jgi:hypothetical protein
MRITRHLVTTITPGTPAIDALSVSGPTLHVRTGVKAGGLYINHNETALTVRTGVKAGGMPINHNETALACALIAR